MRLPSLENCLILCDFDGTISKTDVIDTLLERYADPYYQYWETQWEQGIIGSRTCLERQIGLLRVSPSLLRRSVELIELDPDFPAFVALAALHHLTIEIVSDGLKQAIKWLLARAHTPTLAVFANELNYDEATGNWNISFPYAQALCKEGSGNCKCFHFHEKRKHYTRIIYIGDGRSDFCVAHQADLVLAKGKLADYCQKNGIKHIAVENFADMIRLFDRSLTTPFVEVTSSYDS